MSTIKLTALEVRQNSKTYYLTKIPAGKIKDFTVVDRFRADLAADHPNQGYQRVAEPPRFKKFANYLIQEDHPLCPTAILLSGRDIDLKYDRDKGEIELNSEKKLQIVDGQHRAEGYRFAIYEKSIEKLSEFEVPIIIVPQMEKVTEMQQFRVINGTQKGVRLDLVNMILTQIAEKIGEKNMLKKDLGKVIISRVVEYINDSTLSPWHNLIVMPNDKAPSKHEIAEDPALANTKIVRATSMMTSLKPIYSYLEEHEFLRGDVKEQAKKISEILIDYWSAIKAINPEAFANPSNYVIQKTPGIFALHSICRRVMQRLHSARRGWLKSEFERILSFSESIQNPEFWDATSGEAAKYGSMKGFAELARVLDDQLMESREQ